MSIKSEKFPDEFEELFERFDSPERDKKDVAFLIWCDKDWEKCCQEFKETLIAKNKALKEKLEWALDYKLEYKKQIKALTEMRNELLDFFKRVDKENWLDGDWWADIIPLIEKVEALKEKETGT